MVQVIISMDEYNELKQAKYELDVILSNLKNGICIEEKDIQTVHDGLKMVQFDKKDIFGCQMKN